MIYRFKIDEKSLWYGIYNDLTGQSSTVATPLNQAKDPSKWHKDILVLEDIGISKEINNPVLLGKCLRKTTSKAEAVIDSFFEFNNLYCDGRKIETPYSYGMYIKRETSEIIKHRHGKGYGPNTHLGRKQLHYQVGLKHLNDGYHINNKAVLEAILELNGGFAFVVRGFEYDSEKKSLNFITSMIGVKGIPLSTVFIRKKGVGKKLVIDTIDPDDIQYDLPPEVVVALTGQKKQNQKDSMSTIELINQSRAKNGQLGEDYIMKMLAEKGVGGDTLYHTSKDYPTSLYDIEYEENGIKYYIEVKSTSTNKKVFNMSEGEIKFMKTYKSVYILYLVTDCRNPIPNVNQYNPNQILGFKKEYPTTRFIV
ncbi:MAG: DUF3883 domain-containing protein [Acholeplasmatales bacterium]|nr:DUF3883 domain-containing protein [Acholeplasmatales bacterium]